MLPEIINIPVVSKVNNSPALLTLQHMSFETWFVRMFRQKLLPAGNFSIMEMQTQYMKTCWEEEAKWKEWCKNVE